MASTDPVAALPVVRSPVVREMRGSRALCAGRVMVIATAAMAARTATTGTGPSTSMAAPRAMEVRACAAYPARRAEAPGSRLIQAAAGAAKNAEGTSWTRAIALAPPTPPRS